MLRMSKLICAENRNDLIISCINNHECNNHKHENNIHEYCFISI